MQRTPIFDEHVSAGARIVEFAGWEMPLYYEGIVPEHLRVRRAVGLFDVSHMGELVVSGRGAQSFLDRLTPNDVAKLKLGRAHYNCFLNENGGVLDDCVIYRLPEHYLVVVNAANRAKIWEHLVRQKELGEDEVELSDESMSTALISLQGPVAPEVMARVTDVRLDEMRFYSCQEGSIAGRGGLVSRTGYTGEKGFELYVPWEDGPAVWRELLAAGEAYGIAPIGLGARDTLRLEMRYALYGHELTEDISPLESGLARWVKVEKGPFIGREALQRELAEGSRRGLIGLATDRKVIPRPDMSVIWEDRLVGRVTSGGYSPSSGHGIALALVDTPLPSPDSPVRVEVRGKPQPARIVEGPFLPKSPVS